MSLHRFVRGKTAWRCTVDVSADEDDAPFGIDCAKPAVKVCLIRHPGWYIFTVCGEARCREHDRGSKVKKGAKRK